MASPITGHSVWNRKLCFVYYDVIMTIGNWFHWLVLYYVVLVAFICCKLQDKISMELRNRCLCLGGLRRGSASFRLLGMGLSPTEGMNVSVL